jgi:hypothetical protein
MLNFTLYAELPAVAERVAAPALKAERSRLYFEIGHIKTQSTLGITTIKAKADDFSRFIVLD